MVVAVLTLTHHYNTVRGHRTGSNNSGVEAYLRRNTNTPSKKEQIHTITETNRIPQAKIEGEISVRMYVSRYISYRMLNESQYKPKPRRQNSTHKKIQGEINDVLIEIEKGKKEKKKKKKKSTSETQEDSTQREYAYFRPAWSTGGVVAQRLIWDICSSLDVP